jgi:hypothetical protein
MIYNAFAKFVPTAGQNVVIGEFVDRVILNPAGLLATLTITFPTNPKDGQIFTIFSSQIVTTLTLVATGLTIQSPLTAFTALGSAEYIYEAATSTWLRVR